MESCFAGTFLDDIPILYWIPFHERATGLPRITRMPPEPSTASVSEDIEVRKEEGDGRSRNELLKATRVRLPLSFFLLPLLCSISPVSCLLAVK
jgi:hypothetical protein